KNTKAIGRAAGVRIALDRYDVVASHLDHEACVAFAPTKIEHEDHARLYGTCIRFRFAYYLRFGVAPEIPERDHSCRLVQRHFNPLDLGGLLEDPIQEADAPWKTVVGRIEAGGPNEDVYFGAAI